MLMCILLLLPPAYAEWGYLSCRYTISFVMPSKYTKETLPRPGNENVKIREVPERTFASFAWR